MREDVKALQLMVDSMVGIPKFSYPARQNDAPKPSGDFAHIRLLEEYPVGIPNTRIHTQDELTTTYRTYSPARLRFRVGIIEDSGLASTKVLHGWTSEAMKALMISTGYGFIKCTPISNEDTKLEKEWEFRSGFSIELYSTRVFEEVVDNISTVTLSGNFVTGNGITLPTDIIVNE
jgi:hypothetical protein